MDGTERELCLRCKVLKDLPPKASDPKAICEQDFGLKWDQEVVVIKNKDGTIQEVGCKI